MRISDLFIYPVKSARGIALQASAVDAFGLVGDRRAMVVAPDGKAITQRELPLLARITVEISSGSLLLRMEEERYRCPAPQPGRASRRGHLEIDRQCCCRRRGNQPGTIRLARPRGATRDF